MFFHRLVLTLLSLLACTASVGGLPTTHLDPPKTNSLLKRATEELTATLVCFHTQGYHVALIIDREDYDVSYRYHATQRGNTRTFKLSRDRREGGSYLNSGIPKVSAAVPLTSYASEWDEIDEVINDESLLPSAGYDCWQYIKNALQKMQSSGWVSASNVESSYNELLRKATAEGLTITCQAF